MLEALLAALIAQARPAEAAAAEPSEPAIVVTGTRRGRCRVRLADRALSDRQLAFHAREWAALGTPVTVIRPAGAGYRCMARIAFRLRDHGVLLTRFIDAPEEPH